MKTKTLLLSALMTLSVGSAWADSPFNETKINGITYTTNDYTLQATVKSGDKTYNGSVTIPSSIEYGGKTYSVTSIGSGAFQACYGLVSVSIPNSVISIEMSAFANCYSLTSINIPNSVLSVGHDAFFFCSSLTSVIIPNSVTSMGEVVFGNCLSLTSVTIGNGLTSIGYQVFANCPLLTSVNLGNIATIGAQVFYGCTGLKSITIPSSVTMIKEGAFYGCTSLTEVYCYAKNVPTTNTTVFEEVGVANASLYVPKASIDAYKAATPWSGFGNIKAIGDDTPEVVSIVINEETFPDEQFRNIVAEQYGTEGEITQETIASVTSIDVSAKSIESLKGIEYFTELTELNCSQNQIKGAAMDELIASLPNRTVNTSNSVNNVLNTTSPGAGSLYAIYNTNEQNEMTTTQVAAAKAKGWTPYAFDGTNWVEYTGPTAINNVKASGNNAPAAAVKSFKDGKFVIEDGINQFDAAGAQMR